MYEGSRRADWESVSHIVSTLLNVNRGSKKDKFFQPWEVNPYERNERRKQARVPGDIQCLKMLVNK